MKRWIAPVAWFFWHHAIVGLIFGLATGYPYWFFITFPNRQRHSAPLAPVLPNATQHYWESDCGQRLCVGVVRVKQVFIESDSPKIELNNTIFFNETTQYTLVCVTNLRSVTCYRVRTRSTCYTPHVLHSCTTYHVPLWFLFLVSWLNSYQLQYGPTVHLLTRSTYVHAQC